MTISAAYPFESNYAEILGSKIHYVEKGAGQVFLFLHGNPTWSYLWRNVIPPIAEHGKCVAFDLIGFGKSDKPAIGYRFLEHYRYVEAFIENMKLKNVLLVVHDWGGALGFYYAMNHPENVKGIAFMETFPFTFTWADFSPANRIGFRLFRTGDWARAEHGTECVHQQTASRFRPWRHLRGDSPKLPEPLPDNKVEIPDIRMAE